MMRIGRCSCVAAGATLTFIAAQALAQSLVTDTTRSVSAQYLQGDTVVVHRAAAGDGATSLLVRADTPITDTLVVGALPSRPGYSRALIYGAGISNLLVNAQLNDSTGNKRHTLRAVVSETISGANPAQSPQRLAFSFELKDMFVELWDNYGAADEANPFNGDSEAIGAQISYEIHRDGASVYRAVVDVWGSRDGTLHFDSVSKSLSGRDTSGDALPSMLSTYLDGTSIGGPGEAPRGRTFGDLSIADLDLGLVPSLETFDVRATMSATVLLPAFALGAGARVGIGDPNDLSGSSIGRLRLLPTVPVPEPAAWMTLALGLLALGAWRPRRPS